MSMLAGPRRKQKVINLRAKNNAWSNDSSKFGQRMLEKMGWSMGKGLGANENGIVEHVVARYKNDERGLGFEDKNDQWTKHEDDFNSLLSSLSNSDDTNNKLHSGISLEDKSKKSKARVHYHKFTRAKDLSRYSEKDLANIFGKKNFNNSDEIEEPLKQDVKSTEQEQVFTDKGSMEDYFKSKLSTMKTKNYINITKDYETNQSSDNEAHYGFQGFSNIDVNTETETDVKVQPYSFYGSKLSNTDLVAEKSVNKKQIKKEKLIGTDLEHSKTVLVAEESVRNKQSKQEKLKSIDFEHSETSLVAEESVSKKQRKKKQSVNTDLQCDDDELVADKSVDMKQSMYKDLDLENNSDKAGFSNKNKKRKSSHEDDSTLEITEIKKPKKSKKKKHSEDINNKPIVNMIDLTQKKKKLKGNNSTHENEIVQDNDISIVHKPKKKKKKHKDL